MTPEREKYLAKCGRRELWLRSLIKIHKEAIKKAKEQLRNDVFDSYGQVADCKSAMRANRWLIASLHHELNCLKGMDRVVVPRVKFSVKEIRGHRYTGKKSYYATCKCGNEFLYSGNGEDYCPNCGRKLLWEKVMK